MTTLETLKLPKARKVPWIDADDEAWLRGLACTYARPIVGAFDIPGLVARARNLAFRIESADTGDSASDVRRRLGDELDRGAEVLEQLDAFRNQLLAERREAMTVLAPNERSLLLHHLSAVVAIVDRVPNPRGGEEAGEWLADLSLSTARVLATVVAIERRLQEAEDLRRRAYHFLYGLLTRLYGR